jgi:hypothetical protein
MKIVRLAGLALAAVMALSLVAVSVASAAPLFVPGTGTFLALTGEATLEGGGEKVICEKSDSPGSILNRNLILVIVHFLGCKAKTATGAECEAKSVGATGKNLIVTEHLLGILGLILPSIPGILLLPLPTSTFVTLSGSCIVTTKVTGNLTSEVEAGVGLRLTGKEVFNPNVGKHFISSLGTLYLSKFVAFGEPAVETANATIDWHQLTEVT